MRFCVCRSWLVCSLIVSISLDLAAQSPQLIAPVVVFGQSSGVANSARQRVDVAEGQSTSSVAKNEIEQVAADRAEVLFSMLPGVTTSVLNQGLNTGVIIRGFDGSNYLFANDLPDVARMFVRDLVTVESLEVRQGHSSVLYGSGTPGGALNYRLRGADGTTLTRFRTGLVLEGDGGRNTQLQWRTEADVARPDTAVMPIAWRVVGSVQGGDAWQQVVDTGRGTVMADALYKYNSGELRATVEWQRNNRQFSFGTVYINGQVQYNKVYVGPEAQSTRDTTRAALAWQQWLSLNWQLQAQAQTAVVRRDETLQGYWDIVSPTRLSGYYRRLHDDYQQHDARLELNGKFATGPVKHELTAGAEWHGTNIDFNAPQCIACFNIDVVNPVFNVPGDRLTLIPRRQRDESHQRAVYFFDRMQFGPSYAAEFGARRTTLSAISSAALSDAPVWATTTHVADTVVSAALEAKLSARSVLRAGYDQAFLPNQGQDRSGQFVAPRRSSQRELAYRWRPAEAGGASLDISAYEITQNNITARDTAAPVVIGAVKLIGVRRNRGVDVAWSQPLADDWSVRLVASYVQARIVTKASASLGDEPVGVARLLGSARLSRTFVWAPMNTPLACEAWLMQSGAGRRYGDAGNTFQVAGYGLTGTGARCGAGGWSASLAVSNLFGKRYVSGITAADDIYQGDPRRISVFLNRSF